METRLKWKIAVLAIIGALILSVSIIVLNSFTKIETNDNVARITEQNSLNLLLSMEGDENIELTFYFSSFDFDAVLLPVLNENDLAPFKNTSIYSLQIKNKELKDVNVLDLQEVSGQGGNVIVEKIVIKRISSTADTIFLIFNLIGFIFLIVPFLYFKYLEFLKKEEIEEKFPEFLRDIVEGMKAGMSLPKAILSLKKNDYGKLSPFILELSSKIEWGIPFDKIMSDLGEKTNSENIRRAVNAIIQAHQSGGKISEVLEAVANNLREIRNLKKERKNEMYGEIMTGYVIYIVFIFILISILVYLLPSLNFSGNIFTSQYGNINTNSLYSEYATLFRHLSIIQAIFSGVVIGRLSEGSFKAGGKHVLILGVVGYVLLLLFV